MCFILSILSMFGICTLIYFIRRSTSAHISWWYRLLILALTAIGGEFYFQQNSVWKHLWKRPFLWSLKSLEYIYLYQNLIFSNVFCWTCGMFCKTYFPKNVLKNSVKRVKSVLKTLRQHWFLSELQIIFSEIFEPHIQFMNLLSVIISLKRIILLLRLFMVDFDLVFIRV